MHYGQTLIDKVIQISGGSRYGICGDVGIDESFLAKIYAGKKPLPPLLAAKLAAYVGEDPGKAALEALADSERNAQERDQYRTWFDLPPEPEPALLHRKASPSNTYTSLVTAVRRLFDGFSDRRRTPR